MRCPEARGFLHPFLDGELETGPSAEVLQHLDLCPPCRTRFDDEKRLLRRLRDAMGEPCPDALKMRLRRALSVAGAPGAAPRRSRGISWLGLAATAAAVVVAFVVMDPVCLRGCPTVRALTLEHKALMVEPTSDAATIHSAMAFSADACKMMSGCCCEKGWSPVACKETRQRCKQGAVVRLTNQTKRCVSYVALQGAHVHPWLTLGSSGRIVVVSQDGCCFAGWMDPDGSLCGVVALENEVPRTELVALAETIRHKE